MTKPFQLSLDFTGPISQIDKSDKELIISFSGGRTSAFMTWHLINNNTLNYKKTHVVFANTGQEHSKTLEFVNNCDKYLGFNTVWIEAEVDPRARKGTRFKVVDFSSASRDGEPFEDVIRKYGIPFTKSPHCTRELKEYPIKAYVRSLGLKRKSYDMAIGIRVDEFDRMSDTAEDRNLIYPLVKMGITKQDVLDWWRLQTFDLEIPEHFGNCIWCWKKSFRKLMTVMDEMPEAFDFPDRMEKEYARSGAVANKLQKDIKPFRGFLGVDDIRKMKDEGYKKFIDEHHLDITTGSCSDSCEVFH